MLFFYVTKWCVFPFWPRDPSNQVRVAISCILPHRMGQMDGYEPGNDLGSCDFRNEANSKQGLSKQGLTQVGIKIMLKRLKKMVLNNKIGVLGPRTPLIRSESQFHVFCRIEWVEWMDMSREMTLDLVISGQDLLLVQEEDLLLLKEEGVGRRVWKN